MPLNSSTFVRSTIAAMFAGVACVLVIVGAAIWLVGQNQVYSDALTASRQRRSALVDLLTLVTTAESSQRGFLITSDEAYLAPFRTAAAQYNDKLMRVRDMMADSEQDRAAVGRLSAVFNEKMAELSQSVALAESGQSQRALELVHTDAGQRLMTEAREILTGLIGRTETQVADRTTEQQGSISALRWVVISGAVAIVLLMGASAWMVFAYLRQLNEAQRLVRTLNAELEDRVRERTADLARANEEIQRFAYIVTHDLRAPLVNVMGFTSELEESVAIVSKYAADERDQLPPAVADAALTDMPEAIGFIRASTRKMDGLINAILKLSRDGRRTIRPEVIKLNDLIETALASVRHQIVDAGGDAHVSGAKASIVSDRLSLEQIFGNLFDNAVKYRAAARPLNIDVSVKNESPRHIAVEVRDNGRGIASQDHERVFDLFRRSGMQDQPGEGIGLAHVRAMVRNLGGDIILKSEINKGSAFKVVLPVNIQLTGAA